MAKGAQEALSPVGPVSQTLWERAMGILPGGVNSPVRAQRAVGGVPRFLERGEGPYVWDVDGRRYVDWTMSYGPLVLGHAHPQVVEAVSQAATRGTTFGAPTRGEVELAEEVARRMPAVEKLRLVSSGTEATMSALRLARAFTGRPGVVKFAGAYHGHADPFLVEAGSGALASGVPSSAGVPAAFASLTFVLPYNDADAVSRLLKERGSDIAAVFVEPVAGNMGCVPPEPGFLETLREACDRTGALLVFDEVITGFRVAPGGAQERYGVRPDLVTLGKILGGGLPLAAFGGRKDVMELLAPLGPVYQAGTLSGNPLAVAAGLATLRVLEEPGAYAHLEEVGASLEEGLTRVARAAGVPMHVARVGGMLTAFFAPQAPRNLEEVRAADAAAYARFFHAMAREGILLPPSPYECMFVSLAHTPQQVEETVFAAQRALAG
jgi:glutamate-1-semialdehyde 2,1-aminomutase